MKSNLTNRGFTLVEILVVVSIMGFLSVLTLTTLNPFEQMKEGNDARRKADIEQVQRALEMYYSDKGSYPASSADYRIFVGATTYDWGTPWLPYINKLPADPLFDKRYIYYSPQSGNGQTYYLYATLERGSKDKQSCNGGNACSSLTQGGSGFPGTSDCGGTCSYGVSSPNVSP